MSTVVAVDFTSSDQGELVTFDTDAKRRCTHVTEDGRCITLLNRFNPGPECLVHAAQTEARKRGFLDVGGLKPFPARFLEAA